MQTLAELFTAFGGPSKVGQAINVSTEHAAGMKRRGSIPVIYWPSLIRVARERRVSGVTYESLTHLHAVTREAAE